MTPTANCRGKQRGSPMTVTQSTQSQPSNKALPISTKAVAVTAARIMRLSKLDML